MRVPSPFHERRASVDLQLTPMIDVVFLLLVFFLWSSSFAIVEMTLPSRLSAQLGGSGDSTTHPPPPEADFEDIVVRVQWSGGGPAWTVNDAPIASLAELRQMLESIARIKRDAPIIIDPEGEVPLGNVIDVFDLSRLVGFEKVQFAASAEPQG